MRLSKFIREHLETILQEWEDFASTLHALEGANKAQLRDHAKAMLTVICIDLESNQTVQEGIDKSQGNAPEMVADTAAESHAVDRLQAGFTIEELMAEYRALRASVLRQWMNKVKQANEFDLRDMLRFNEAIDQSLTESIGRFSALMRESQNVFLAILGHDVRNPLGAISMGTQMIMQDTDLPARHLKVAAQVLRSSERVGDIVSDLLDYSTSHLGGGIPVTLAPYDFSTESKSVVHEMALCHPARRFDIAIDDNIAVEWDRARVSQALSNLIGNAVQHGAKASAIAVSATLREGRVQIVVHNEGLAIPPAQINIMFDPAKSFAIKTNSERSASQTDNLGLGLYITHQIVLAHGGTIRVTSSTDQGTTMTIDMPARPATAAH